MLQGNTFHAMVSLGSKLQGSLMGMSSPPLTLSFPPLTLSFPPLTLSFPPLLFLTPFISFFALWRPVVFFPILKYVSHEMPPLSLHRAQLCPVVGWSRLEPFVLSLTQCSSTKAQVHRNICFLVSSDLNISDNFINTQV